MGWGRGRGRGRVGVAMGWGRGRDGEVGLQNFHNALYFSQHFRHFKDSQV